MKRQVNVVFFIILLTAFLLSGCTHPRVILSEFNGKRLVSEKPKMYIDMTPDPSQKEYLGELTLENGEVEKIVFKSAHGVFNIWRFNTEGVYGVGDPPLFSGKYIKKDGIVVLKDESGLEIILKAQEIPTSQASQATTETTTTSSITSGDK